VELRQIRSFLSIAETLHFGRTAELIHISQPALSLQIRALEEEVAVRLFHRNRPKTTLTAAESRGTHTSARAYQPMEALGGRSRRRSPSSPSRPSTIRVITTTGTRDGDRPVDRVGRHAGPALQRVRASAGRPAALSFSGNERDDASWSITPEMTWSYRPVSVSEVDCVLEAMLARLHSHDCAQ
jgi:hypothetical protein